MLASVGALFQAKGVLALVFALGVTGALVIGSTSNGAATTLLTAPCSGVSLSASPASPQAAGTTVLLTASATGCGSPQFRYLVSNGTSWSVAQDWTTSPSFSWNTTGLAAGSFLLRAMARDAALTAIEVQSPDIPFVLTTSTTPCSSVALAPSVASPQAVGTTVLWTASATACSSPQFKFSVWGPTTGWTVAQDWTTSPSFGWNTTGLAAASYLVKAAARAAAATSIEVQSAEIPFTLTTSGSVPPCTAVALAPSPASPQVTGTTIVWTASASGCTAPQFRFWLLRSGAFTLVQDWSSSSTFTWTTTGLPAADYAVVADARASDTGAFQASTQVPFTLTSTTTPPTPCPDRAAIVLQVQRVDTAFAGFHTDLEKLRGLRERAVLIKADVMLRLIRHAAVKAIHATTAACAKKDDDEDENENEDEDDGDDNDHHGSDKSMDLSARATVLSFVEERNNDEDNDDHGHKLGITFTGDATAIADQAIAAMQVAFDTAKNAPVTTSKPTPAPRVENRSKPVLPTKSPDHHKGEHGDRD